ncbi:MAG: Mitochondrial beta-keto-acyl synthase [Claussenomyces sp. TS43310]|nr:MAG: Mitochondrial beta-keto-acyl synthase [Claussenomyces sp. TS43310]
MGTHIWPKLQLHLSNFQQPQHEHSMRRVVVTGLGAITPLGVGLRRTWARLLAGESGIVSTTGLAPQNQWAEIPSQVAGLVPLGSTSEGKWQASDWLQRGDGRKMATFTQYAIAATEEALLDADWKPTSREQQEMTGVCLGSGIGNLEDMVQTSGAYTAGGYKKVSPLFVPRLLINLAAGHISMKYGLQGPNHSVTTACTTGAHSIGDAARFIAFGDADVMVAGGSESCIHPLTLAGFARSRSLSTNFNDDPSAASRPFDRDRSGFVVAEGAGVIVLEEKEHAEARKAKIYAEIVGYGCSGDAHHMTAPREDGDGALLAMRKALKNAGLRPAEVGYINAHATSTPVGDAAENAAIKALMLGDEGFARAVDVTVSSTKGALGHLLGAAGAIEAIFAIKAVEQNLIPPTLNLHNLGDGFDLDYVPLVARDKVVNVAVSNSFGFGGTNASLVFAKHRYRQ